METDRALTLSFAEVDPDDLPRVGGKGANLGALTRAGVSVPPGFCLTTRAFDRFIAALPDADARFAELDALDGASVEAARAAAEAMRSRLDALVMPEEVAERIAAAWRLLGPELPLAVRSSATAEDLPGASFAGQQDTYLNIRGEAALLDAVRRCWISLFTDRAVLYRARGRFGHRAVKLAVVVQRLIDPDVSGILFTADPLTGHRGIASIDAGFGLGEALVSGLVNADLYRVDRRTGEVLLARAGDKAFAIRPTPGGGTTREALPELKRRARTLTDEQARALAGIGARIESHFGGAPQDIEWCIAGGAIWVVQARPITSLFPIPAVPRADSGLRVFVSFGHVQVMLDAMPKLAQEVWRLFFPAGKGGAPSLRSPPALSPAMAPAASRLYIDVTALLLRDPAAGARAFDRALEAIPRESEGRVRAARTPSERIRRCAVEMNALFRRIRPHLSRMIAGFVALALLRHAARGRWADQVRGDVGVIMRGLPGNVTTQMDLAAGDLADLLRPHPELAALLEARPWAEAQASLPQVSGGAELAKALDAFLSRYGNRGASEIDISRPRWRDDPSLLVRVMTGGRSRENAGVHRRQHEAQVLAGEGAGERLVAAAGRGPLGPLRRAWMRRLVRVARFGMGLREHPKFILVQLLGIVRTEALAAGEILAGRGQLSHGGDVWQLGFDELAAALDDPSTDLRARVADRASELQRDQNRRPPIAMSSDGEIPAPAERAGLPPDALPGTAVSAGVVEGIARVVTDPAREVLHAGEILVAPFTDPGWTPLFVHAIALVTEVGGMMTHGAVVAREYGIPAVVSVASAVERIKTGQRIRVDGTRGFVQILQES